MRLTEGELSSLDNLKVDDENEVNDDEEEGESSSDLDASSTKLGNCIILF